MFEAHVLHLIRKYLGEYVQGLSLEALRISVWKGDVVLKDLKLKTEALNSLRLPVTVKAGFVGTVTLKVPWKSLGKEPVIVLIDRVFVLAQPALVGQTLTEEDREKLFEAKLQQIEEAESATLEAISRSKLGNPPSGNSWLGSLISTIIGNLKISISNVHIRYEDSVSNPGYPFCTGVTLAKLAAVTMDEQGNETFDASGALDKLRKLVQLDRLAMYHDSNTLPWSLDKKWEDLTPKDWIEIFEDGINEPTADHGLGHKWAMNRNYLVSPINGILKYHRLGNLERDDPEIPYEKASLVLGDVSLTITEAQYHDWIKLLEVLSRYKTYVEVSHLRPMVPVLVAPKLWWHYAVQAGLRQNKMCYRFSWEQIRQLCQLRRRYIKLYAGSLQRLSNTSNAEIREIEKDLDSKVILLWRLLAHAKVESVKSKEAAEQKRLRKSSWFSFSWRANSEDTSDGDASEGSHLGVEQLTKEEWQEINKLLSYQQDEDSPSHSRKDAQNTIQLLFTVSINQAAARIVNINQTEIVCGRFEQLSVSTKLKQRSIYCDVLLKFYGLSSPEGSLAQSVSSEQKVNALAASFIHMPVGENIDWRLSATISPCYVTILMDSCDRFLEFLRRSNEVSPTVALETAAALQVKFEKVTRRAQEQFQIALEEQSRFALDIDLDAPKVRVPIRSGVSSKYDSHFLLDFGHFMLRTMGSQSDERRHSLYSRFFIAGRDIAALFRDCSPECEKCSDYSNQPIVSPLAKEEAHNVYPLLDQFGMAVVVDQIKVPHPSHPSTRISIQVPNLGIHFSPSRYCKIMELLNTIYSKMETYGQHSNTRGNLQPVLSPWGPVDLTADARILVWRGIGNSVAQWKPCYLVLSGLYIYVLESGKSQIYQRHLSVAGKQVHEVPSSSVGGSLFCIALSSRGMDIQKALESSNTWVIEFQNEVEKSSWSKRLLQATYQASAPPSMDILGEIDNDESQLMERHTPNMKAANLVINGALVEAKLLIYGKTGDEVDNKFDEILILELLASGGKVHIILGDDVLSVKTKLHSLLIKDQLQGHLSTSSQYLARSVLSNEKLCSSPGTFDPNGIQTSTAIIDEDDSFTDALPDFLSLSDVSNYDSPGHESTETIFTDNDIEKRKSISSDIFYEAEDSESSDFVVVTFLTRGSDSPDYDGIDTQMSICMSKMEFYCNRPTLVALIGFGFDISSTNYVEVSPDLPRTSEDKPVMDKEKVEEKGLVKGLLGHGKSRVVFYLNMNVASVAIYLNMEDGSQFAMLVQESFLFELKVHPSSLSIEGTLGNFRLCDMSLGEDHCWGWLCDIRNPGVESLINFKFLSYSVDDDDYEGYDYCLHGRLSAVRIVFLYRFVSEITVYFMGLATPHTEEAVKLVDKVGDFEWLIQKYEIDGAAAVKLDLSLDTPIIIVPKNSNSKDFIQLDLGHLQVTNEFSWHGCPETDASAVHIDVLHAEILGVNMSIGINGRLGKPMIQEGQGLDVYVRRSLRDVFRKVPTFSLEVVVGLLHGMMSDKEYKVIVDCLYMNLYEPPILPPDFRGKKSESTDTMRLLVDMVNTNSQILLSRSVTIVTVTVNKALLELCSGTQEESPLALIALEGLWVSYRMTSFLETDLYLTIPKFSILDIRPVTKPEMRLMLGSSTDTSKQASLENFPFLKKDSSFGKAYSEGNLNLDVPVATMFVLDYRWRKESQSFVLRVQQPRVLVVPDFLLAVVEFFVPALRAITGREESMDSKNDPICRSDSIVLTGSIHRQSEDVILLSPSRQLIADTLGVDDYTYDGCGNVIRLMEETDAIGPHSGRTQPIVVIGCAKRLRFINVKIENGSLLRKYTYLGNDSSYSVSEEDDVDIIFLDTLSSDEENENIASMHENSDVSNMSSSESDQSTLRSFTFETQVVSPEFTFYDGTKSSLDDLSYGEKLLRAKLDMSFMYASKENDTWIRALVKDFTIEAGSGLVILDPVDVSGGYTSVKDKTNMSLVTTDICIHLSLSAISLILNLQSQAGEAMMFGNAVPLVACINFDKLWVSPRENGSSYNLTVWRPRAPSNYVILGDCVTSRPVPPSQAVMAVSNTYGRVRKPLGFQLIGVFSRIQGFEFDEKSDIDCSIWMPVPPLGYTAVGCVANVGNQPPPTYVVYCIRSDLVSSTTYSECVLNSPSNSWYASGFSIWRMDNVIGSFIGHASTNCPEKDNACDLNHLLKWNSNPDYTSFKEPSSNTTSGGDTSSHHSSMKSATSSGWDILRSISKATNCYLSTPNFERIWWDKGNDARCPVSIWRPVARPGYAILGDFITEGLEPPALGLLFKADNAEISAKPLQFTKVAHIFGKGFDEAFFWYPIAPPGYASLGCVVSRTDDAPRLDSICCPRMDLVSQTNIFEMPISRSSSSRGSQCWSIWKVSNQACTFLARSDHKIPSSRLAYTIGDSAKPKTHENVTAEMKIRFFSLTVLDSLHGMMKPLFDTTVTNIKLATHGSLEAMNAVLISSIAASTFNTQLEAWEPLIEPFDGIFKFETYDTNVDQPPKLGKRIRIAATSIVNVNVSASNLETFIGGILSWRRQLELEERVQKLNEEAVDYLIHGKDATFSALDEDDLQTAVVENKLGCEIYLKRCEQNLDIIDKLPLGDCMSVWIPPPRFSDRLNVADESREPRYYVAVQIIEAKGLPVTDDGNSHSFFCALRLVIEGQVPGQQKLFPQSARTKCVKPLILKNNLLGEGMARWNEYFIFEVPRKGSAKLEVEVTNLAAKAGKGEVVGALSFSVGHGSSVLKKVASVRMVHQTNDVRNIVPYTLKKKFQQNNLEDMADCGILLVSTSYFERRTIAKFQRDTGNDNFVDRDTGFWVGLREDGEWQNIRSLLPLSTTPILLQEDYIAMDVVMRNGKKHAILRGLVTVVNDSDVNLDISICHVSLIQGHDASLGTGSIDIVVEEIFENQRYHPNSGWSDQLLGYRHDDPRHWSTGDSSHSSKDFFEPPLPPGWQWTTTWTIDKTQYVDNDGWGYGPDFTCLKWPLTSFKSCKLSSDVVRRRRWVRTRQRLLDQNLNSLKTDLASINPGASASLPWRSTLKDSDQCLLVRPSTDQLTTQYTWGRAAFVGSVYACGKDQALTDQGLLGKQATSNQENKFVNFAFKLNQLEKKDVLLCCNSGNKQFWLSIGADASVLHTELNAPVYDWKISVNSPIKLENRLPCSAEFTIWERTRDGKCIERQNGIIVSRGSEQVYSADAQKPLYLTLFVQGGWILEKADPILLLDPASNDPISTFSMVHQRSRRRLRLSVERVMGGTTAGPKIIRFHVPYWIINDSSLSLAYRVVELEPPETVDSDSVALSRAVKSAKMALRNPINSLDRRYSSVRRNALVLEEIEDTTPVPSMFSPQDYAGHSGAVPFTSQKETHVSPRVGIAIAMRNSDIYSAGLSLLELENKERVDVKAFSSDGSYYKLSTLLSMTSDRTKVVRFQPHTLFINRLGCSLCLQQCDSQLSTWFHPYDPPKPFGWQSYAKVELLKLRVEGYKWSTPFSLYNEGMMRVLLKKDGGNNPLQVRVEVRSGAKCSRYEVIFRPNTSSGPYRIENRSAFLPIRFRQADGTNDSWKLLLPNTAVSFIWEDLGRRRLLELLIDGSESSKTDKYDIDEISDHQPVSVSGGPSKALHVTIVKEEKINVVLIRDWMPESEPGRFLGGRHLPPLSNPPRIDFYSSESASISNCEYHVIIELAELGISLVDHTPEEILYLSVQNLLLAYSTGLDSGISRLKLRMSGVQVDNQLPLTPMPVLFRPQRVGEETDYILKFSVTMQSNGSMDLCIYPYIGFHGPESYAFSINIHEPIIWRLHEMMQLVNLSRLQDTGSTAVSVDPVIQIRVLHISEVRFRLSMAMSPSQRPRGVLGFWSSLMTALGNTENMPIRINQRFRENVCMRQSSMVSSAISSIRKDLLSQPLQLLSGVDILGNASSALGHMSKGVAALSMDKKFIQSRQRQENKGVEDLGDVIREGGGALAKGLFRGVTGILTKPLEGAKTSGVEGFVQGVGKGIIGAAAQPVSGVLDLLSKTTEGANAVRMKIASVITSDEQLLRRRLPRVISGDNLLRPYDNYKAQGQVILQLAESGSFFVQVDLFKVRGKFALSDAYEDHFLLPKGKILVVTHRRVILMQQPSTIIGQRKFSPAKDACSVLWDVLWGDLVTMEFSNGKKDHPKSPPSRLILYLQSRSTEMKDHAYVVKCGRGTDQALRVYASIERAMNTYGQNQPKEIIRVRKPYSPIADGAIGDYIPKEGSVGWAPQQVSPSVPFTLSSAFGSSSY